VAELIPKSDAFFHQVAATCVFKQGRVFRVREPGLADASELNAGLLRLGELLKIEARQEGHEDRANELEEAARRLRKRDLGLRFSPARAPRPRLLGAAYARKDVLCALHAAPIQPAEFLRRMIFREHTSTVLTSATLSVGGKELSYFRTRVGAQDCRAIQIGSPFDYQRQMTVHMVRGMPEPKDPAYDPALEKWIAHFVQQSQARAFVLFTSYQSMRVAAQALESQFATQGWRLLVQGNGMPHSAWWRNFAMIPTCSLWRGSFWSGSMCPAKHSSVIITTPLRPPDHPLPKPAGKHRAGGRRPLNDTRFPAILKPVRVSVVLFTRSDSAQSSSSTAGS
jgi:ATP-dependent DNA helicase DinG